jgi:hypothetical protein
MVQAAIERRKDGARMAKRDNGGKRTNEATTTTKASDATTTDAMEQRVVAFAEQLGRIVGTVQAKTEGWMDRDALNKQIAGVRDSAADLLEHLAGGVTNVAKKTPVSAAANSKSKGRSGGVVDAPGKKHRKPMPKDPRALAADAKASNMRAGKAMMKTVKLRGRG